MNLVNLASHSFSYGESDELLPCLNTIEKIFIAMFAVTLLITLSAAVIMNIPKLFVFVKRSHENLEFMDEDDTQRGRDKNAYKLLTHYWISYDSYFCRYVAISKF